MTILCKNCGKAAPELQEMEKFTSLKPLMNHWLCESCRNIALTFKDAPEPTRPEKCIKCDRLIKINRKGNKKICWRCVEKGVPTKKL